uniref:Uncharacterized protein n=1 Tax=Bellilinea caldifistulae TaxID=360411 RepID=A0A7C4L1X5_9CHLR
MAALRISGTLTRSVPGRVAAGCLLCLLIREGGRSEGSQPEKPLEKRRAAMKHLILFLAGAGLYLAGVDFETLLGLDTAAVDTILLVVAVLFAVVFIVLLIWTAVYIGSGQYALDRRLDQWIK